ncbi:hypothetical protein QBC39DRAFT_166970 [Podospora conica]|nr:hypothetical protein QBC39DRAFT_166970 [Schizothecium conicum]
MPLCQPLGTASEKSTLQGRDILIHLQGHSNRPPRRHASKSSSFPLPSGVGQPTTTQRPKAAPWTTQIHPCQASSIHAPDRSPAPKLSLVARDANKQQPCAPSSSQLVHLTSSPRGVALLSGVPWPPPPCPLELPWFSMLLGPHVAELQLTAAADDSPQLPELATSIKPTARRNQGTSIPQGLDRDKVSATRAAIASQTIQQYVDELKAWPCQRPTAPPVSRHPPQARTTAVPTPATNHRPPSPTRDIPIKSKAHRGSLPAAAVARYERRVG